MAYEENADRSGRRAEIEARLRELGLDPDGDLVIPRGQFLASDSMSCADLAAEANHMHELSAAVKDQGLAAVYLGIAWNLEQQYHQQCVLVPLPPNVIGGEVLPG